MGQLFGKERLLDEGGNPQLLIDPFSFLGFGLLLADELGHANRRRHLGRQSGQQLAVVGRIGLVGQAAGPG